MNERKLTNILLLIIVVPLVFYLLKILSFIFVPLFMGMLLSILFLPIMRWFKKKGMPKIIGISTIVFIILAAFKVAGELFQLSAGEILASDDLLLNQISEKLNGLLLQLESFFGVEFLHGKNILNSLMQKNTLVNALPPIVSYVKNSFSLILMTLFFALLLLNESINIQKLIHKFFNESNYSSIKTFMEIEKDLFKFIKVKFIISLFTGICVGLSCWGFGVSFPIFWGLFAFIINFVQMIGSIITVVLVSLFAFIQLDSLSMVLIFSLINVGIQTVFGGILEPVFMGKSFSISVITIVIMLMFWGYIWGVPGLIMSVPITVFLKILFQKSESTKGISKFFA